MATSSLAYILDSSDAAKTALQEMLHTGGADVGTIARVADEVVGEDQERVDLVAYNEAGEKRVLIEAKFWAHLTENQPGTYLKRLPKDDKPAVLLFLAPEKRLHTLWPQLRREARKGRFELVEREAGDLRTATIAGSNRHLMLTSWRALLCAMEYRAGRAGDVPTGEDIRQLKGLCDREDSDAFLPIRADELGPEVPRRLRDLKKLVDDAIAKACKKGLAEIGQRPGSVGSDYFGKYFYLGSKDEGVWATAWFGVDYSRWRSDGYPLWIDFNIRRWEDTMLMEEVEQKLGYRERWLDLPVGREYEDVLNAVVDGLRRHADRLAGKTSDAEWARNRKQAG